MKLRLICGRDSFVKFILSWIFLWKEMVNQWQRISQQLGHFSFHYFCYLRASNQIAIECVVLFRSLLFPNHLNEYLTNSHYRTICTKHTNIYSYSYEYIDTPVHRQSLLFIYFVITYISMCMNLFQCQSIELIIHMCI